MGLTFKQLDLPLESTELANGLRVVVHEDRSSPIVAVHTMFRAGSRDETRGRTGLAHLLEHLLFEGSENCPKGQFDRLLERVGGTNNGSTWLDRTNYYEVVPSHAVELALWLERERMGHFLPVLDEEMLEIQRSVVINERKQAYENRPYGLAFEKLHALLFPGGHPYSWPTIGYAADLEEISLSDARSFYERYYAPNNAVLVLAGDLSTSDGFRWAERYLGDLPTVATRPAVPVVAENRTPGDLFESFDDRVSFPRVHRAYVVPPYGTKEWVHLDVLSYLLADGESSRLQRVMIREKEIVQDVDTFLYPSALAGIFGVVATARTGIGHERLLAEIDGVLDGVINEGVTEAEVQGALRRARRDHLNGIANMDERAEELAYAATVLDAPERLAQILNSYAEVTPVEVQRIAREYLGHEARATVVVLPVKEGRNGDN